MRLRELNQDKIKYIGEIGFHSIEFKFISNETIIFCKVDETYLSQISFVLIIIILATSDIIISCSTKLYIYVHKFLMACVRI